MKRNNLRSEMFRGIAARSASTGRRFYPSWPQLDRWLANKIASKAHVIQVVVQELTSSAVVLRSWCEYLVPNASKYINGQCSVRGIRQKNIAATNILGLGFPVCYRANERKAPNASDLAGHVDKQTGHFSHLAAN